MDTTSTAEINNIFCYNQPINYLEFTMSVERKDLKKDVITDILNITNNGIEPVVVLFKTEHINRTTSKELEDIISAYRDRLELFAHDKMVVINSDDDRLTLQEPNDVYDFIILLPDINKINIEDNFTYYAKSKKESVMLTEEDLLKKLETDELLAKHDNDLSQVGKDMLDDIVLSQDEIDSLLELVVDKDDVDIAINSGLLTTRTNLVIDAIYKAGLDITSPIVKALVAKINNTDNEVVLKDLLDYTLLALLKENRDELTVKITMKDIVDKYILAKL